MTSKNNKKFAILKISDLVKYDLDKVKQDRTNKLEGQIKKGQCDKSEIENALKHYTPSGYKQMSVMCFGDAATTI